jgi:hypothetical protein
MSPSDKVKGRAEKAFADYDAHLTKAEDHLAAAARNAEASFKKHTAVPEAHLEKAEDHLEVAAHDANTKGAERAAQARERIAQAREHVSQKHR